jgi:hypothetical protein
MQTLYALFRIKKYFYKSFEQKSIDYSVNMKYNIVYI